MYPMAASVTESCTHCPHFDKFHSSCTHELRQSLIQEISSGEDKTCPLFPRIHAEAMQSLEGQHTA